jgi:hypothetical protein
MSGITVSAERFESVPPLCMVISIMGLKRIKAIKYRCGLKIKIGKTISSMAAAKYVKLRFRRSCPITKAKNKTTKHLKRLININLS